MTFIIEVEREQDGRCVAEVPESSGVLCYGQNTTRRCEGYRRWRLRAIAEGIQHREAPEAFVNVTFKTA